MLLAPRRIPKRSKSFENMKGFLNRSLSFRGNGSGRNYSSLSMDDEQNIFCADLVTNDFIIDKLMEVKNNTQVIKLEIEDLLVSPHHTLFPIIKSLVVLGKRDWQWIRFVDSVESDDFAVWQQKQRAIMQDYEATIDDASKYKNTVSFNATIRVDVGTPYYVVRNILQSLRRDPYLSKASFECMEKKLVPSQVKEIIDPVSGETTEEISLTIVSGWSDSTSLDWKVVLDVYIKVLDPLGAEARNATPSRSLSTKSIDGASTHRRKLRRTKSAEGSPFGPQGSIRRVRTQEDITQSLHRNESASSSLTPPNRRRAQASSRTSPRGTASMPLQKKVVRRSCSSLGDDAAALKQDLIELETRKLRSMSVSEGIDRAILTKKKSIRNLSTSSPRSMSVSESQDRAILNKKKSIRNLSTSSLGGSSVHSRRSRRSRKSLPPRSVTCFNEEDKALALLEALLKDVSVSDLPKSLSIPSFQHAKRDESPDYDWSIGAYLDNRASWAA